MVALQITTVDKYQGQQNDFVLLSLVRTRIVGHLRDVRRLVVALSRCDGLLCFFLRHGCGGAGVCWGDCGAATFVEADGARRHGWLLLLSSWVIGCTARQAASLTACACCRCWCVCACVCVSVLAERAWACTSLGGRACLQTASSCSRPSALCWHGRHRWVGSELFLDKRRRRCCCPCVVPLCTDDTGAVQPRLTCLCVGCCSAAAGAGEGRELQQLHPAGRRAGEAVGQEEGFTLLTYFAGCPYVFSLSLCPVSYTVYALTLVPAHYPPDLPQLVPVRLCCPAATGAVPAGVRGAGDAGPGGGDQQGAAGSSGGSNSSSGRGSRGRTAATAPAWCATRSSSSSGSGRAWGGGSSSRGGDARRGSSGGGGGADWRC